MNKHDIEELQTYVGSLVNNRQFTESYIDETIERFDAFMEEFNLTQMEDKYNE